MARLSHVQRDRAVGILLVGRSIADVARISACTRATIHLHAAETSPSDRDHIGQTAVRSPEGYDAPGRSQDSTHPPAFICDTDL